MNFSRLEYIKNVNDDDDVWAYESYPIGAYFPLNFKKNEATGVDNQAFNLPQGSLIILSQKRPKYERTLTHVVELVNEGSEDKPQWETGTWGIFRWVKVHWIADFKNPGLIPLDHKEMIANWGWFDTKAKLLSSENLMKQWGSIDALRAHLEKVFN
ncbi:hypothetical protein [Nostoc sp. 'Peltigera malacea cyanobiont' DB3992]|uniref:hypothetical protein n=1 Tax=Nostoc sp. 'Peltigera malacea cyanobiont' DB3992 TaxID=1206980 RepID=UPI000C04B76D|nr:hypothetical protein [Nostoc sp. 'Peltigera malacea cyanobiont' DB3992]PHM08393.1 hypothetical protein CK516_21110 [Nostoc sp. 'Peltigera malacea cyanobiont' DB3992]